MELIQQGGYKERGVVLHTTAYGDSQLIVHLLTRTNGRQSYITRVAAPNSKRRGGVGRNLFQPLFLIEFEAARKNGQLHTMSQVSTYHPLMNLPFDIVKSTIALFVSEIIYRLIYEPLDDERLYEFVESSIILLDNQTDGVSNFHLWFMTHLLEFMGYAPSGSCSSGCWLDIKSGSYTPHQPQHTLKIAPELATIISLLSSISPSELCEVKLSRGQRVALLEELVNYYSFHSGAIRGVNSIRILSEVF